MTRLIAIMLLSSLCAACGEKASPSTPTPVTPACQTNATAILHFENRTTTRTHDLYLDNANVALIGPGQTSQAFTVAAAVQHTVQWVYTNTRLVACTATPVPAICSTTTYFCAF
jgi:hypothetical protein